MWRPHNLEIQLLRGDLQPASSGWREAFVKLFTAVVLVEYKTIGHSVMCWSLGESVSKTKANMTGRQMSLSLPVHLSPCMCACMNTTCRRWNGRKYIDSFGAEVKGDECDQLSYLIHFTQRGRKTDERLALHLFHVYGFCRHTFICVSNLGALDAYSYYSR